MLLLVVLDEFNIDLEARLRKGNLLEHSEIEALVRACSLHSKDLHESEAAVRATPKVVRLKETVRMKAGVTASEEVQFSTKSIRLHYIRMYLMWASNRALLRHTPGSAEYEHLLVAKGIVGEILRSRMPTAGHRNTEDQRQGLAPADIKRLTDVVEPGHPANPWSKRTQLRNNLLIRWYLSLGLRRSELLSVKVADINFQSCEVLIARRPDDIADPRKDKPVVKTNDKLLPLDPELARDTHSYVVKERRITGEARRHPYLFVANSTGAPLSMAAVNLVFTELRRKVPGLPDDLTPHVLRHTWNDRFSELADREKFSEAEESRMRSRLQGWSPTSKTAAQYTRRHVQKKAREASLALQAKLDPKGGSSQ